MSVRRRMGVTEAEFGRGSRTIGLERHSTTIYHGTPYHGLHFQPTERQQCPREASIHPAQSVPITRQLASGSDL